jgi:hypothetical protein
MRCLCDAMLCDAMLCAMQRVCTNAQKRAKRQESASAALACCKPRQKGGGVDGARRGINTSENSVRVFGAVGRYLGDRSGGWVGGGLRPDVGRLGDWSASQLAS